MSELAWWEQYADVPVAEQRRALYGRACHDLVAFIQDNADMETYPLLDLASEHFRDLLEATLGLAINTLEASS
jgi:hypothetical protein